MKKIFIAASLITLMNGCEILNSLPQGGEGVVTEAEAGQGIKDALSQGLTKAVLQLNKENGFFGNTYYKILLPPDARKVEKTLRDVGLGSMVDKAILQINRGAEDAVGFAQPIFINAINQMTPVDAINIVKGGDSSITHYFREKTTTQLTAAFLPVIKSSLDKVNATKYYSDIVTKYNSLPLVFTKVNPDLNGFVTEKTTNTLFDLVLKEEKNIRENPVARTNDILKKVFGSQL